MKRSLLGLIAMYGLLLCSFGAAAAPSINIHDIGGASATSTTSNALTINGTPGTQITIVVSAKIQGLSVGSGCTSATVAFSMSAGSPFTPAGSTTFTNVANNNVSTVTYTWTPAANQTGPISVTFVAKGTTATCGTVTDTIIYNFNIGLPVCTYGLTYDKTNVSCFGGSNGSVSNVQVTGASNLSYSWSGPGNYSNNTANISGLAAGSYQLTVSSTGCSNTKVETIQIDEPTDLTASATATDALCNGSSDGSVDLTVGGGTAPYSYSWSNSATTQDLNGVPAGTYSVTVTDDNGCTETAEATVGEPDDLTASATATDALCNGSSDGSVDLTVGGGTAPYSYSWSNNATTQDLSGVPAGTYSVTVTDDNGCTETAEATVGEPDDLTASAVATDATCNGDSDGSIDLTVGGGTAPYSYSWDNSATTEDLSGLSAAAYSVTVTDDNGCTETANATVGEPTVVSGSVTPVYPNSQSCYILGYNNVLNQSITFTPNGGTSGNGGPYTATPGSIIPTVAPYSASAVIKDSKGCSSAAITVPYCIKDVRCGNSSLASGTQNSNTTPIPGKVSVCHKTGNGKYNSICVEFADVANHLAHGDVLGQCAAAKFANQEEEQVLEQEHAFGVYPNPANSKVTVTLVADAATTIHLVDLSGRAVRTQSFAAGTREATMDLSGVNAGIYFLSIQNGNASYKTKLVVQ